MYCSKCGKELSGDAKFCDVCGSGNQNAAGLDTSDKKEVQNNKVIFMLSYLGFLFFLPLITCPDSKTGRFHANQGLVLLITGIVGQILLTIVTTILSWRLWTLTSLLSFVWSCGIIALVVIGMIHTNKGEEKPLPIIGGFRILK